MLNPQYTRANITNDVDDNIKGDMDTTIQDRIINRAVRDVIADPDIDFRSTKKIVPLSLSGDNFVKSESVDGPYDSTQRASIKSEADKYYFHCPTDLKQIIDIRKRFDKVHEYELTTPEEFLRRKASFGQQVAIDEHSFLRRLMVSGIPELGQADVHNCNTYDGDGTWAVDGSQITAVATETSNYVYGTGAIGFTTVSGACAGGTLTVDDMTAVDISAYENHNVYMWVYIPMATGLTSFTLKWGSSASAYESRTVTKTHDNNAFYVGWNLLKFSWADATETGTNDEENIDYLQLTVVKGATNTGTTGWIMDRIIAVESSEYDVVYYSDFGWQTSAGVYIRDATEETDLLNANADEYAMLVFLASAYCSGKLDNSKDEAKFYTLYNDKKAKYVETHPSERKLITTVYESIASTDDADIDVDTD